jgi:hypothetical protein
MCLAEKNPELLYHHKKIDLAPPPHLPTINTLTETLQETHFSTPQISNGDFPGLGIRSTRSNSVQIQIRCAANFGHKSLIFRASTAAHKICTTKQQLDSIKPSLERVSIRTNDHHYLLDFGDRGLCERLTFAKGVKSETRDLSIEQP